MRSEDWRNIVKGLALSSAYCAAYWMLWNASFDQWFLPAGLRVATCMFMPYRLWPHLFIGDAAALLLMRVPKAEQYSATWAYLSPFLLMPSISAVVALMRRRFNSIHSQATWLPLNALLISAFGAIVNLAVNHFLSGPALTTGIFERFLTVSLGYYLGILILILPCMLCLLRGQQFFSPRSLFRDSIIAGAGMAIAFSIIVSSESIASPLRQAMLMLMILPAAGLTFLHGWRGAAIGIIMVNLAIAQTLPYTGRPGTYDATVFLAQLALVLVATVLLALGSKIEQAHQLSLAEKHALDLARSSFLSSERNLREKVLYMAQMQVRMDEQRKSLVETLKANEQYSAAMLLNNKAVEHMQSFEGQAAALYPIHIEERGLYAVIYPESFTDIWAGDAEVNYALMRGQPRTLTVDLQLTAYRCICNAFALLSECAPDAYALKLRVWRRRNRRGISIKMTAMPTQPHHVSRASALAESDLERRVKAYGGAMRRRPVHSVRILLWEAADTDVRPQDSVVNAGQPAP
ncbi:MAG: MASE1 domain-containing protein [Lysobacteraceae bacterium]